MRKWYVSFLAFRFKHRQAFRKCLSSNILNNNVQSTKKKIKGKKIKKFMAQDHLFIFILIKYLEGTEV